MKYKHEQDPNNWLRLYVLNNCFNDKNGKHLGLKWDNRWYCITHNSMNEKVLIPKSALSMRDISPKNEYLKRVYNSAPNILNPTNMSIAKSILIQYIEEHGDGKNE